MKKLWTQLRAKKALIESAMDVTPQDEPTTGLPGYVKLRYSARRDRTPLYEQTANALGYSPLETLATGALALPQFKEDGGSWWEPHWDLPGWGELSLPTDDNDNDKEVSA